jgi:iron complex transport system ATP-binding protein
MISDKCVFDILNAKDVEFSYQNGEMVLKGVGLDIRESEILGILGPNGSGKTTFIKCLNKILSPLQGEILLQGDDIKKLKKKDIAKNIGFVPQTSEKNSASPFVYDVVMMGRKPHMTWQYSKKDDEIVWDIMEELDIAHLASRYFNELSSGQTQRVLIARAIVQDAAILLLDEPTSNLDVRYQIEVMSLIRNIVDTKKVGACAIVHDLDLAMRYCDRVVLLNKGHIVSAGNPLDALTPKNIMDVYGVEAHIELIRGRNRILID